MKTWLITGAGRGIGNSLARQVLGTGDNVIGTVRTEADADRFQALEPGRAEAIILDLKDHAAVGSILSEIASRPSGIDVLVNNAGYGLYGAVEEVSIDEVRQNFDVNFFGALACIQSMLPSFRARKSGHIVNITSVSGLAPWAGTASYGATKYALECLGQTLAQEMAPFGIKVTNVAPGGIETEFAKNSLQLAKNEVTDYRGTVAHYPRTLANSVDHTMPSDVEKVAKAVMDVVAAEDPPVHLLLGADAVHYAGQQMSKFMSDMTDWMTLTMSTAKENQG
ncbi:MAG: SDR family NAD(P)-dependent oxidoreductase [Pseudomonadota bacterium]